MQIRYGLGLATIMMASACGRSQHSTAYARDTCGLSEPRWHLIEVSPPNRVLVWRVLVDPVGLQVNGDRLADQAGLAAMRRSKALRPSPYLILTRGGSVSCERIANITHQIDNIFDCEVNYCYYPLPRLPN